MLNRELSQGENNIESSNIVSRREFLIGPLRRLVDASGIALGASLLLSSSALAEAESGESSDRVADASTAGGDLPEATGPIPQNTSPQAGPPRISKWERRPKGYTQQDLIVSSFDSEQQSYIELRSDNGHIAEIVDGKLVLTKPVDKTTTVANIARVSRFNGAVDLVISDMQNASDKAYVGFQIGTKGKIVKYGMRPKTHEFFLVGQTINEDLEGSNWEKRWDYDFGRFPKPYYDISAPRQRFQFVWDKGIFYPLVNDMQIFNGTLWPEPYTFEGIEAPMWVSLIASDNKANEFKGVFDDLFFEKQLFNS